MSTKPMRRFVLFGAYSIYCGRCGHFRLIADKWVSVHDPERRKPLSDKNRPQASNLKPGGTLERLAELRGRIDDQARLPGPICDTDELEWLLDQHDQALGEWAKWQAKDAESVRQLSALEAENREWDAKWLKGLAQEGKAHAKSLVARGTIDVSAEPATPNLASNKARPLPAAGAVCQALPQSAYCLKCGYTEARHGGDGSGPCRKFIPDNRSGPSLSEQAAWDDHSRPPAVCGGCKHAEHVGGCPAPVNCQCDVRAEVA